MYSFDVLANRTERERAFVVVAVAVEVLVVVVELIMIDILLLLFHLLPLCLIQIMVTDRNFNLVPAAREVTDCFLADLNFKVDLNLNLGSWREPRQNPQVQTLEPAHVVINTIDSRVRYGLQDFYYSTMQYCLYVRSARTTFFIEAESSTYNTYQTPTIGPQSFSLATL